MTGMARGDRPWGRAPGSRGHARLCSEGRRHLKPWHGPGGCSGRELWGREGGTGSSGLAQGAAVGWSEVRAAGRGYGQTGCEVREIALRGTPRSSWAPGRTELVSAGGGLCSKDEGLLPVGDRCLLDMTGAVPQQEGVASSSGQRRGWGQKVGSLDALSLQTPE